MGDKGACLTEQNSLQMMQDQKSGAEGAICNRATVTVEPTTSAQIPLQYALTKTKATRDTLKIEK